MCAKVPCGSRFERSKPAPKNLPMSLVMRLPLKVSTATSNFMIGITAGASEAIYFRQGFIDPCWLGR
jgi:uncharacterized membrane protein YfcA